MREGAKSYAKVKHVFPPGVEVLHFWFRRRGTFSPCSRNWPCGPTYLQSVTGLIPSSLQSSDTEVSRCAIAAWASGTWAFDSANFPAVLASARTRGLEPPANNPIMRLVALCTLPRTDPGTRDRYIRRNGPYRLVMTAGGAKPRLPYGSVPRLLLAWMCTEATRTKSPQLHLGHSLAEFMRTLGIQSSDSGGEYGVRTL